MFEEVVESYEKKAAVGYVGGKVLGELCRVKVEVNRK